MTWANRNIGISPTSHGHHLFDKFGQREEETERNQSGKLFLTAHHQHTQSTTFRIPTGGIMGPAAPSNL